MGGEKALMPDAPVVFWGSPPRRRGKEVIAARSTSRAGITPAWAGKSAWIFQPRCRKRGSPPRGRGKDPEPYWRAVSTGITPAWAGKSAGFPTFWSLKKDHPRVGGEKGEWDKYKLRKQGSPPRGRGKVYKQIEAGYKMRITPAWAGKSTLRSFAFCSAWDHPRVGGEKTSLPASKVVRMGSPPRGRGKAAIERVWKQWLGITPAWVGKSTLG